MPTSRRRAAVAVVVLGVSVGLAATMVGDAPVDADGGADPACAAPSAAARWNDVALAAIRRDFPAPTIHARNLYHLSAAMWDAWAAWDDDVPAALVTVDAPDVEDVPAARAASVAAAAHGVLVARDAAANGALASLDDFAELRALGCDGEATQPEAVALGEAVARRVLAATVDDGGEVREPPNPANPPLEVARAGVVMVDPDRWQPLELEEMVTQNGIALDDNVQRFVGWSWGAVTPFAPGAGELTVEPPPRTTDPDGGAAFRQGVIDVLAASSRLDPRDGVEVDISPAVLGDSTLGTDDGTGHPVNPATGRPYPPNVVLRGDHDRAIAEFWADGPTSETPPGHWNVLAREVADRLDPDGLRVAGVGEPVDRLTWDVHLGLALNGALHDAAIAAWGTKATHDSSRPISMIRWLAGNGQSSDPNGPAYHPAGIPLVDGLVEIASTATLAAGGRHEGAVALAGDVVVRAWTPTDPASGDTSARVRWFAASRWVPYQQPTFVTPSFAGYVSGHSAFSRAAAEVLAALTGDPFFPGGLASHVVPAGSLAFEDGPTRNLVLQWATYADAADEAGRSRIAGGIHVPADDHAGRVLGAEVGRRAWDRMEQLLDG